MFLLRGRNQDLGKQAVGLFFSAFKAAEMSSDGSFIGTLYRSGEAGGNTVFQGILHVQRNQWRQSGTRAFFRKAAASEKVDARQKECVYEIAGDGGCAVVADFCLRVDFLQMKADSFKPGNQNFQSLVCTFNGKKTSGICT